MTLFIHLSRLNRYFVWNDFIVAFTITQLTYLSDRAAEPMTTFCHPFVILYNQSNCLIVEQSLLISWALLHNGLVTIWGAHSGILFTQDLTRVECCSDIPP